MRLGTRFALLIIGTLAVPLLAMSLVAILSFAGLPDRIGPAETIRAMVALNHLRRGRVEPARVSDILRKASPDNVLIVFDQNQNVVYSSLGSGSLVGILLDTKSQTSAFNRITLTAPDGAPFSIVVGFQTGATSRPWLGGLAFTILITSVVGFMTMMSILIIRSINVSIARLEEGTRRISAGDLDFELSATGSDRIASLTRSFDQMRQRVRQDAEARSRFIMSVSHDLKTPLSSITGYLDAITDGIASDPAQKDRYLSIIRDKAGILESRISQLIDYVKLETGEWRKSRESVQLAPFLLEAMTVFHSEAEARGYGFESSIDIAESVSVSMDVDLVSRALENLVQNAFRYADPGSTVRILASRRDACAELRILNQGTIASKDLPFIFDPFYRGTPARREGGFGLGLSVVKWVASSHGWTLDAASHARETSFTIGIPLTPEAAQL